MNVSAGSLRLVCALAATLLLAPLHAQEGGSRPQASNPAAGQKPAAAAPAKAQDSSYSVGVSMGDQLRRIGVTPEMISTDQLTQGLRDALSGKAQMSADHEARLAALVQTARTAAADRNKAAARKFLAENGKKKGVVTTASGLQYRVISPGKGTPPKPTDEVTVHYRGMLLDGTEFDSSIARGEPATFPANAVIDGWQEALALMQPGAKWELFIPPELAYDVASPPAIPPGSLLHFEVELLAVKPMK
jgi:FKBP-type peptidyl-prolyl cis-trans isomerase